MPAKSRATTPTICIRPSRCLRWEDGEGACGPAKLPAIDGAYFVPEPHTDSIVCVLVERLGLWGLALLLASVRGAGLARIGRSPQATREPFGRLVAIGIATLVGGANADQYRHDGRAVADHRAGVAAGQLRRVEPAGQCRWPSVCCLNIGLRPGYEVTNEPFQFAE